MTEYEITVCRLNYISSNPLSELLTQAHISRQTK